MNLFKRHLTHTTRLAVLAGAFLSLTACGPKGNLTLKGVDLSTSRINNQTYINMDAVIVIDNLKFPNLEVPILNPMTMKSFGQLALQNNADGTNRMYVSVDFEAVSRLDPSLGFTLPNGREIPIILGAQNTALIGIPILQNSRIYVGGDLKKDFYLGAAISISAFDNIMNQVDLPVNVFMGFPFSSNISGVAGLFGSPTPGQNGIAIFAKKTVPTATPAPQMMLTSAPVSEKSQAVGSVETGLPTEIERLDRITLYRLNRLFQKKATLKIK